MKKVAPRKLALTRETLRELSHRDLSRVPGGNETGDTADCVRKASLTCHTACCPE